MKQLSILAQILVLVFGLKVQSMGETVNFAAKCDSMLAEQFKANEPGATVLVARGEEILYTKAFGMANLELQIPMRIDHVFRIGSITKQFTAVAILQLVEQGKLSLQDELTKFIPDYPTQGNKITIENLLTHTAGIRNFSSIEEVTKQGMVDFTPNEMIDLFKNQPIRFTPGTKWEYSNSGYFLLGYIIELITGESYATYLEKHIFQPTGMHDSRYASDRKIVSNRADGYSMSDQGIENSAYLSMTQPYAAGAIQSTVEDLYKWNKAVHSNKLITKQSLDRALTPFKLASGEETKYGYGWRFGYVQESPSLWHGGMINGFIAMAMYLPNEDVFVAVLSNCDCNSPEDVTAKLAALAIGNPYEYKAISVEENVMKEYVGVYENDKGLLRVVTVSENQLFSQMGRGPKSKLTSYSRDKFVFDDDVMVSLEFKRSTSGAIEKVVSKSRTGKGNWIKTDKPMPSTDGIKLYPEFLQLYVGEYEVTPEFTFVVTRENDRLFVEPTGQEVFEIFAETPTKFFLKINDAQLEFIRDEDNKVTKAILTQGGRATDAKKIK